MYFPASASCAEPQTIMVIVTSMDEESSQKAIVQGLNLHMGIKRSVDILATESIRYAVKTSSGVIVMNGPTLMQPRNDQINAFKHVMEFIFANTVLYSTAASLRLEICYDKRDIDATLFLNLDTDDRWRFEFCEDLTRLRPMSISGQSNVGTSVFLLLIALWSWYTVTRPKLVHVQN